MANTTITKKLKLYEQTISKSAYVIASDRNYPIGKFLNQMQNFYYCPPSNNLWTVEIKVHNTGDTSGISDATKKSTFQRLYKNIIDANKDHFQTVRTIWGVSTTGTEDTSGLGMSEFMQGFETVGNLFMAQSVVINSAGVQDNSTIFSDLSQHGGFIAPGRVINARTYSSLSCSINFLESNWSIMDLIIDPWLAAIAQRGLTKWDDIELTADIFLTFYAQSAPQKSQSQTVALEMIPQKQISIYGAYPVDRDSVADSSYDYEKGGIYRNCVAKFNFDDYSIKYLI